MNSLGHFSFRILVGAAVVGALTWSSSALFAYHQQLDESDIMSAYNLGHGAGFQRFLADYEKAFPPATGIYVSRISIRTPFCNLVQLRHQQAGGPSEMSFRDEYLAHPDTSFTAILSLEIQVARPPSGLDNPRSAFWKSFQFALSQDDPIPPRNLSAVPLILSSYDAVTQKYIDQVAGAELYLQFDVNDIPSKRTHLKVTAPDGSELSADFDLAALR